MKQTIDIYVGAIAVNFRNRIPIECFGSQNKELFFVEALFLAELL